MPITIAPDPSKPGGWIWVDQVTGKPALQPGGPGTPFIAPSDLSPQQQQQQQLAESPPGGNPAEQARILGAIGRAGWQVVGSTREVRNQSTSDPRTGQTTTALGPTDNEVWAISGPNGENDTVIVRPPKSGESSQSYQVVEPPKNLTKAQTNPEHMEWNGQQYERDSTTGQWVPARGLGTKQGQPDEDILTAVKRQNAERDRDMRQRNEAASGYYITDQDRIAMEQWGRTHGLSEQQIRAGIQRAAEDSRRQDAELQIKQAQLPGQLGLNAAQTTETQARANLASTQGSQVEQATERSRQLLPLEVEEQRTKNQIARAPQLQNTPTGAYTTQVDPTTGQIQQGFNAGFQPKTQADVAARVGQMQSLALAKKNELNAKIGQAGYTAEQANSDFNTWWDQNIENQKAGLEAAQQEAQFQRTRDEATMRQGAMQTAQGAGTQAINAFNAEQKYRAGPGLAEAFSSVKPGVPISKDLFERAFMGPSTDLAGQAQRAVNDSLKYISPMAAQQSGMPMPNYGAVDINAGLNRTNYGFGGAPPGPPMGMQPMPMPAPVPAPEPPMPLLPAGVAGTAADPRFANMFAPYFPGG